MEKLEREHRRVARGADESTPVRALNAVFLVCAAGAGVVIAAAVLLWVFLR
jgi:hypothetical protein